jgi:hypothetical protein
LRVQVLEFDARLVVGELPVDPGLGSVAGVGPSLGFASQCLDIADATREALFGEDVSSISATSSLLPCLGGVMDFQAIEQAACLGGAKAAYKDAGVWVLRLSQTTTTVSASG